MSENQEKAVDTTSQNDTGGGLTPTENKNSFFRFLHSANSIIYKLHLYGTKGEALIKLIALLLSWSVCVFFQSTTAAYYFFSISILMEYIFQLLTAHKFIPKILPFLLVVSNIVVFVISSGQLCVQDEDVISVQVGLEIFTMAIICIDTLIMLLLEPPESNRVESNISQRG